MRRTAVLVVLLAVCSVAAPAQSKIAWINSESIMQTLPEAIDAAAQTLAAAKNGLRSTQESYKKACDIQEAGQTASSKAYTAAVTGQESAYLNYEQAKTNADQRTVTAPISGYITTLSINNGDQVSGGSSSSASRSTSGASAAVSSGTGSANAPVVITDLSALQASVQIAETDRPKVAQGQPVQLTFDAVPDLTITGKVAEIDAVGTASSGVVTYNVTTSFDVQDKRLTPGMTASASIVTSVYSDVLLVPNTAVKTDSSGASYVQVLSCPNGTPQNVSVTIGAVGESESVVTSGLKEGQEVEFEITEGPKGPQATNVMRA